MTVMSATRSTVISSSRAFSGNTTRATQLPYGSCCQFMKCFAGFTLSVALDGRAAMRRGAQPHFMGRHPDQPIERVQRPVVQRDFDHLCPMESDATLKLLNADERR